MKNVNISHCVRAPIRIRFTHLLLPGLFAAFVCHFSATAKETCSGQVAVNSALEFNFPRDTKISVFLPEDLELVTGDPRRFNPIYKNRLDEIHRGLQYISSKRAVQDIEIAFNPFAGTDGPMAFALFPNARIVVASNNRANLMNVRKLPDGTMVNRRYGYAESGKIQYQLCNTIYGADSHRDLQIKDHYFLPELLGHLTANVPNFRLRKVILHERNEPQFNTFATAPGQSKVEIRPSGHGIIEFDSGPRTVIRRYIHIDSYLFADKINSTWWIKELDRLSPQAVIVKASMGQIGEGPDMKLKGLRSRVEKWVTKAQGFLVEGRTEGWGDTEVGWEYFREDNPPGFISYEVPLTHNQIDTIGQSNFSLYGFGYSRIGRAMIRRALPIRSR